MLASNKTKSSNKSMNIRDIIIKSKNQEICNSEETMKNVIKTVKEDTRITIESCKKFKNGKISVRVNKDKNINEIKDCIKEKMGNEYDIKIDELKKPRIKIIGIKEDISNIDLESDIANRNKFKDSEIKILYKYKNNNKDTWSIILDVDKNQYAQARIRNRIYIGSESCRFFDYYDVTLCYKCLKYGHKSNKCEIENNSCGNCGENHMMKECTNKNKQKCKNCHNFNEKYGAKRNCNHAVVDFKRCESYKKIIEKVKCKIDYNYER